MAKPDHKNIEALRERARSLFEQGLFAVALETCDDILLQRADDEQALELRGLACARLKRHECALHAWRALRYESSHYLHQRMTMIRTLLDLAMYEEAKSVALSAIELWPGDTTLLRNMVRIHSALDEWGEVVSIWSGMGGGGHSDQTGLAGQEAGYIKTCGRVAQAYFQLQQYSSAEEMCRRILALRPDHARALNIQARVHQRRKEWQKALRIQQSLSARNPKEVRHWVNRISNLFLLCRPEQALETFGMARSHLRNDAIGCARLSLAAEDYRWHTAARELEARAFDLAPTDSGLLACLIEGYWKLERVEISLRYAMKLQALDSARFAMNGAAQDLLKLLRFANMSPQSVLDAGRLGRKVHRSGLVASALLNRLDAENREARVEIRSVALVGPPLFRGGAERQMVSCIKSLLADPRHDFDVFLYAYHHDTTEAEQTYYGDLRGLPVVLKDYRMPADRSLVNRSGHDGLNTFTEILRLLPVRKMENVISLCCHFEEQKPDIVHAWLDACNIDACLAALIADVPKILLSARGVAPDNETTRVYRPSMRECDHLRGSYAALLGSPRVRLCHNSAAGAESYREWLGDPSLVFPLLINGTDFHALEKESGNNPVGGLRDCGEMRRGGPVVGTVARFVPDKQPFLWIEAARRIHLAMPGCRFVMVGNGPMLQECRARTEGAGMGDAFFFPGALSDVKNWLALMDLFLFTSKTEGLPNALIEAQGFGVPVVTTDAGGASEAIVDGGTGWIVPDDADEIAARVVSCLQDKPRLAAASVAARIHARQAFSVERMYRRLLELYFS